MSPIDPKPLKKLSPLGQRIDLLCKRSAPPMSQADLARAIGIKQPSMHDILYGRTKTLKGTTLRALCDALHTTPDFLLTDTPLSASDDAQIDESEVLHLVRQMSPADRADLVRYGRWVLSKAPPKLVSTSSTDSRPVVGAAEGAISKSRSKRGDDHKIR